MGARHWAFGATAATHVGQCVTTAHNIDLDFLEKLAFDLVLDVWSTK
jgi:hypothetical protein